MSNGRCSGQYQFCQRAVQPLFPTCRPQPMCHHCDNTPWHNISTRCCQHHTILPLTTAVHQSLPTRLFSSALLTGGSVSSIFYISVASLLGIVTTIFTRSSLQTTDMPLWFPFVNMYIPCWYPMVTWTQHIDVSDPCPDGMGHGYCMTTMIWYFAVMVLINISPYYIAY